ncbi:MAG TPA: alpha-amylase family protein [Terracidiphilus sp.]|nr:alpha-amylase family protein [Terracidiphilus sp.]
MINRREFLKAGLVAVPLAHRGEALNLVDAGALPETAFSAAPGGSAAIPWQQKLRRIGQTNFTEHDPAVFDVEGWADYWSSVKVGAVYISVTGILAYYPSQVPFHRHGKYLNGRDFFGDLYEAARKRNLRVVARYSPDLNWGDALGAHPDWFMRDKEGKALETADTSELFQTCMFSAYMTDYFPAVIREVMGRYDVDAHYSNGWPSFALPVCFCEICRTLPPPRTPAYWDKFNDRVTELFKLYNSIAHEKKAESFYFLNMGGGIHATPNLAQLGETCHWFQADNQGRGGNDEPIWGAAQQGRVCNAVLDGKMATNITGAWSTGPIRWREVTKTEAEARTWFEQTVASGLVPYYHVVGGETGLGEDLRWKKIGRDFFDWTARHDAHLVNKAPIANIGVVFGQRTQLFYKAPYKASMQQTMDAIYYALLEGRFLFDFVHEDRLQPERINKYSALILPNIALLSDAQCAQLRAYVEQGGSLLATFETSMYTEGNERRADFGLADVFGIHATGAVIGRMGNANPYLARIERKHPVVAGFEGTHWIPGSEFRVPLATMENPVLTVVPGYVAYPPELSYPPVSHTREPAVVIRERGKSRLIYIPGNIEATMWLSGHTDLSQLLQNSIRWVAGENPPVTIEGKGLIESFAWETEPGYAVHVLNYTNPNLHRGWVREFYAIGEQKVSLRVGSGRRIARVDLLRSERTIPFHVAGDRVEFTIPSIESYEVAALTLA